MLRGPYHALSNGEPIEEERPQQGHCHFALLAVPECAHVQFAVPQRDGVASVRIALISRQPLVLEALYIAPQRCRFLVRRFKAIPLVGSDPSQIMRIYMSDSSVSSLSRT
jgi:hypothetical protein